MNVINYDIPLGFLGCNLKRKKVVILLAYGFKNPGIEQA